MNSGPTNEICQLRLVAIQVQNHLTSETTLQNTNAMTKWKNERGVNQNPVEAQGLVFVAQIKHEYKNKWSFIFWFRLDRGVVNVTSNL